MNGRIELYIGPMFAGKTTSLKRRVEEESAAGRRCFVVKYAGNDRYDVGSVATHDGQRLQTQASARRLSGLAAAVVAAGAEVVAVDEGQFFADLVDFCVAMADAGRTVIVSALDGDFERRPFGPIPALLPHCEVVVKLKARCAGCRGEASFTRRTVQDTRQELIGGADMYLPTCRACYLLPLPDFFAEVERCARAAAAEASAKAPASRSQSSGGCSPSPCQRQGSVSPKCDRQDGYGVVGVVEMEVEEALVEAGAPAVFALDADRRQSVKA